jgi:hypothetical protein
MSSVAAIKDGAVAPLINLILSLAVVVGWAVPQCGRFEAWVLTLDQDSSSMVLLRSLLYDPATEHSFNLQVLNKHIIPIESCMLQEVTDSYSPPSFTILPSIH